MKVPAAGYRGDTRASGDGEGGFPPQAVVEFLMLLSRCSCNRSAVEMPISVAAISKVIVVDVERFTPRICYMTFPNRGGYQIRGCDVRLANSRRLRG